MVSMFSGVKRFVFGVNQSNVKGPKCSFSASWEMRVPGMRDEGERVGEKGAVGEVGVCSAMLDYVLD